MLRLVHEKVWGEKLLWRSSQGIMPCSGTTAKGLMDGIHQTAGATGVVSDPLWHLAHLESVAPLPGSEFPEIPCGLNPYSNLAAAVLSVTFSYLDPIYPERAQQSGTPGCSRTPLALHFLLEAPAQQLAVCRADCEQSSVTLQLLDTRRASA